MKRCSRIFRSNFAQCCSRPTRRLNYRFNLTRNRGQNWSRGFSPGFCNFLAGLKSRFLYEWSLGLSPGILSDIAGLKSYLLCQWNWDFNPGIYDFLAGLKSRFLRDLEALETPPYWPGCSDSCVSGLGFASTPDQTSQRISTPGLAVIPAISPRPQAASKAR